MRIQRTGGSAAVSRDAPVAEQRGHGWATSELPRQPDGQCPPNDRVDSCRTTPVSAVLRRRRPWPWIALGAFILVGLAAGGWLAEAGLPPATAVLTVSRELPAGHRLVASDLAVFSLPVAAGRDATLLPEDLQGLVPGEYLTQPALPGAPLLTTQIAPGRGGTPQAVPATSLCRHD